MTNLESRITNHESRIANCESRIANQESEIQNDPLRHRITFATRRALGYISVLELGRIWERSLRRANVPLRYSQGYNPRPKLNFAAPLPVGCGSDAELMDILLAEPQNASDILTALAHKTPDDLTVLDVSAVPDDEPALSEQLIAAEYRVWLRDTASATVQAAIEAFLDSDVISMAKRGRKYRGKTYNLRPLIEALCVEEAPSPWTGLWMRVQARPGATGRPDEVLKALNLTDLSRRCTRTQLILTLE